MGNKTIISTNEAEFIGKMHEASVSGVPTDEVVGRCYKELLPAFVQWMDAEKDRGTPDGEVLSAVPALVTSIAFTATLSEFPDKQAAVTMADELKGHVDRLWKKARKAALKS